MLIQHISRIFNHIHMLVHRDFEQIHFVLHLNLPTAIVNYTKKKKIRRKENTKFSPINYNFFFFLLAAERQRNRKASDILVMFLAASVLPDYTKCLSFTWMFWHFCCMHNAERLKSDFYSFELGADFIRRFSISSLSSEKWINSFELIQIYLFNKIFDFFFFFCSESSDANRVDRHFV